MIKNKSLIFIILVLALLSVGVASAEDSSSLNVNDTQDSVSVDNNLETTVGVSSDDGNSKLQSAGNDDVLGAADSFDNLQKLINNKGNNQVLTLTSDYKYGGSAASTGITISYNNFTINGNGHTIDVNNNGRIFYITGNNVTLKNLVLTNIEVNNVGGAIYNEGTGLNVVGVTFKNITAYNNGGAIHNDGDNGYVKDSKFVNITAYNNGGAIYTTGTNFNVANTIFENITINAGGGAIWNDGDNLKILDSSFKNITVNTGGGAIYTRGANLNVTNSNFTNITAKSDNGGAINNEGENFTVINSKFTGNFAKAASYGSSTGGGAIWYKGNNLAIINSAFISNKANNDGGAIWYNGENLTLLNSEFSSNTVDSIDAAYGHGGAVYHNGTNLNITNSTFKSNKANTVGSSNVEGGAVYHNGANLNITNSTFASNGKGIYQNGANVIVLNSTFDHNDRGIYHKGNNFIVLNSTFKNGVSYSVIYHVGNNLSVNNSNFTSNGLSSSAYGVIYHNGNNFNLYNSIFTSNSAYYGGAIYNYGTNLTVINSNFTSNHANYGGVIYNSGSNENNRNANLTVINSNFTSNYAYYTGGAIYNQYCNNVSVINSNFTGNYARSGSAGVIYNSYGDNFIIVNSSFTNSTADSNGGVIYNYRGNNFTIVNSSFTNSTADYHGGVIYNSYSANFTIVNSSFTNSKAAYGGSGYYGGVIYNIDAGANFTIVNSTFVNSQTTGSNSVGGVIYNTGANFTIVNSTFTNSKTYYWGGVIYNTGANFTIVNSNFTNSSTTYTSSNSNGGGAIYNAGDYLCVVNATFDNSYCSSSYSIGGVIYNYGKYVTVTNSTFTNNKAGKSGGAIYNSGINLTIANSTFTNSSTSYTDSYSGQGGGAIWNSGNYLRVVNATFDDSRSTGTYSCGGAILNSGKYASVINATFTNSTASKDGGAIYNTGDDFLVANSTFTNSSTTYSSYNSGYTHGGGAIYNSGANFILANSTFTNSKSAYCGGTIYNSGNYFTLKDSNFTGSSAKYDGGLIFNNKASDFKIMNSTFINSTANANGGMICNYGGSGFNITDSTFINSTTLGSSYSKGGLVYYGNTDEYYYIGGGIIWNSGSNFVVRNSKFANGTAKSNYAGVKYYNGGGAIYNKAQTLNITNSSFVNNVAEGGSSYNYGGGAIYNYHGKLVVSDSNFTDNDAVNGAVIYNPQGSTITLSNNKYSEISETANTHIFNNGTILSPVVITVLGNQSIPVDLYATVELSATVATEDGASVAGHNLTFVVSVPGEEDVKLPAVTHANGTYTNGSYYINSIAPIVVSATYAGTTADTDVKIGMLLSGDIPSNVTVTVTDNLEFAKPITVNATVGVAGGAKINVKPTGNVTFIVKNEKNETVMTTSEIALDTLSKASNIFQYLNAGTYTVWVNYGGDNRFKANSTSTSLTVVKVPNADLKIKTTNVHVGEDSLITVQVPDHATGNVTISVGGAEYNATIDPETSLASITVKFDVKGNHSLTAKYLGDMNYEKVNGDSATLVVSQIEDYKFDIDAPDTEFGSTPVITVTLPEDINGTGWLSIDGGDAVAIEIKNGKATYRAPSTLTMGQHTINVTYHGDSKYMQQTASTTLNITELFDYDMNVTIKPDSFKVGEDVTITVAISEVAFGGTVSVTLDKANALTKKVETGVVEFTFTNLSAGSHSIKVNYTGYGLYGSKEQSFNINVDKWDPNMNVTVPNPVKVLENTTITIALPEDATGKVTVYLKNHGYYYAEAKNGSASVILPALSEGSYSITISYAGDNKYLQDSDSRSFTVSKISEYTMNITAADAKVGEDAVINLNLPGGASGNVTIEIDGIIYKPDIVNDVASITLNNLTDGVHTIFATYSGDGTYSSSYTTGSVNISKVSDYELIIDADPIEMNEDAIIEVTVPEGAAGRIIVTINGREYPGTIVGNKATISVSGLTNGTHVITAAYDGNDKYAPNSATGSITVSKVSDYPINITVPGDVKVGDNAIITVNLPKDATGIVNLTVGDKTYNTTVNNGVAIFNVSDLANGTYNIKAEYFGNDKYTQGNNNSAITVSKLGEYSINVIVPTDVKDGENSTIIVELPADASGKVNVTIDGKNYTADVEKGVAKVNITGLSAGDHNITVSYPGNDKYDSITTNSSITVSKIADYNMNITADNVKVGDNAEIKVNLPADATGNVTVNIDGVNYNATKSGDSWTISLNNLTYGKHTIIANYSGNDKYASGMTTGSIDVSKVSDYPITIETPDDIKVGDVAVINVTLPADVNGFVSVKVGNKTYYVPATDGKASVTTDVFTKEDDYSITVTYNGDDKYANNTDESSLAVSKVADYPVIIDVPDDIKSGDKVAINVTLPSDANGVVVVKVGDKNYTANVKNGFANIITDPLDAGSYTIDVTYGEDSKYADKSNSTSIISKKTVYDFNITVPEDPKVGENTTIIIDVPKNATGNVTVTIDDNETITVPVTNGTVNITIPVLPEGEHNITIDYSGDENYTNKTTTVTIESKGDYDFVIDIPEIADDKNTTITVTVPKDATGNVTVAVDGENYTVPVNNGTAEITIPVLPAGEYNITTSYSGDDNYAPKSNTTSVISKKTDYEFNVTVPDAGKIGENTTITVEVPDDADGNITITIDNETIIVPVTNGTMNITIPPLSPGEHNITVNFTDDKYGDKSVNTTVVSKGDYDFVIDIPVITDDKNTTITVNVPKDATGNVTVTVDGENYTVPVNNGTAEITIPVLPAGEYNITTSYSGDDNYAPKSNSTSVISKKTDYEFNVTVPDAGKIGENTTITVEVPDDADGNITITIDGNETIIVPVTNGTMNITIPPLNPGEHNITVNFTDDKYGDKSVNTTVESKGDYDFVIDIPVITDDKNTTITVNVPKDATGNVTVTVDGENYTVPVNNGTAEITIPVLPAGEHNITTTYSGDDKYASKTNSTSVISKKTDYDVNITIPDGKIGENTTITVDVPDDADGNVTITIDGNETITVPVTNGTVNITIPPLSPGEHNITVNFTDDKYDDKSVNTTVESKGDYDFVIDIPEISDDKKTIITVTVPDDATGDVTVTVDGKNYTVPVTNGTAEVIIPVLPAGEHNITTTYSGDDKYASKSNSTVVVSKKTDYDVNITIPDDMKPGDNSTITIDVPDDADGNVTVIIDGNKTITVPVTNGTVNITIPPLEPGDHDIIINYTGDGKYNSTVINKTVTVGPYFNLTVDDVVMIYKDGSRLYARLLDVNGNPVANATLSFTINGVTYTRTTDENGTASIALNLVYGTYAVVVSYDENTTVNATVTIKSSIIGDDLVKMWRNGTQFYATFLDQGAKPLANTDVKFNINGVFYTRTTDENGTAKLNINLYPGSYILTAYNPVNGEQRGFNVLVKPLIETSDLTKYYINASKFEVKVYNYDGSLAANKTVTFNINGVFYHRTADENGSVKLSITLRPGDYIITSMYEGLSIGNKVKVLPTLETSDLVMKYNDGSKFSVKTLDGQGNPLANQTITFNVNGVFYQRTTDDNGVANLNINLMSGEYIITSYWNDYEIGNKISIS